GVPGLAGLFIATSNAQQGRFAEAAAIFDTVLSNPNIALSGVYAPPLLEAAVQVLRASANKSPPPEKIPVFASELNFVYAYTSTPERMLEWPENALKNGDSRPLVFTWWPMPSSVRKTERFKRLVRDAGLVDYWKARGWPDLCHPTTSDDFECS